MRNVLLLLKLSDHKTKYHLWTMVGLCVGDAYSQSVADPGSVERGLPVVLGEDFLVNFSQLGDFLKYQAKFGSATGNTSHWLFPSWWRLSCMTMD